MNFSKAMLWASAAAVVVGLAACSADDAPEPDTSAAASATAAPSEPAATETATAQQVGMEPTWQGRAYVHSLGIVNDVAVVVASGSPDLLTGVDTTTGEVLWETPTNRGSIDASVSKYAAILETADGQPLLVNAGELAVENDSYVSPLQLLDPATGEVAKDLGNYWIGNRWDCPVAGSVCVGVWDTATDGWSSMRINPETLELEPWDDNQVAGFAQAREYSGDVYGAQTQDGEQVLVRVQNGQELWRIPASDALGVGAVVSADAIAASGVFDDEGVVVITGDFDAAMNNANQVAVSGFSVVALDQDTGEVLWTDEGKVFCMGTIACSGDMSFVRSSGSGAFELQTGSVTFTGIDPLTGDELWSTEASNVEGLTNSGTVGGFAQSEGKLTVTADGVVTTIDADTGESTELGDDYTVCFRPVVEQRPEWSNPANDRVATSLGTRFYACNATGIAPSDSLFTEDMVEAAELYTWQPAAQEGEGLPSPRVHVVLTEQVLQGYEF